MPETFGDIWRQAHLHASAVEPLLVRQWTLDALRKICAGRRWSWLRRDRRLSTQASRSGTFTVSKGSTLVTGTFTAQDLGRQIRAGNSGLPYSILGLNAGFTEATLDQPYTGISGSATLTVLEAFLFMPADFDGVRTLSNYTVQQPMPWWYTAEQLDFWDPNRIWQDSSARIVAGRGWQQTGPFAGRALYEWWPYPNAVGEYGLSYYAKPDPKDSDTLPGTLQGRGYLLREGALVEAATFPGNADLKNPYYQGANADRLRKSWELAVQELNVRDDDIGPGEQYQSIDWRWVQGLVPMDTHLLRSTDATLADYAGGGAGFGWGYY